MCNKISICRSRGGISLRRNFSTDYQVTTYLRKKYGVGKILNLGLGSISPKEDLQLKHSLIKQESYQTLASIHSGIESKYEFMKQVGLLLTVIIFLLTTMLGGLTFFMQQSMKNVDWSHDVIMLDLKAQSDLLESHEWLKDPVALYSAKHKLYKDSINEQIDSYNIGLINIYHQYLFSLISVLLVVVLIVFLTWFRYMWISSIHFCVKEAYKQKEKIENKAN
ncbi:hypothetical protein [Paenibacillus hunanensis]|uniref:Uncharacterized protein n=1 Tax=Paenibacillus hunanensis TaxID=539262 RepID=A0ABU1IV24_9BACL|nr:hypothetical protein [Paenibacillus hunanensis]MDR6243122.1 hypothetical protein [Paenibacillus hunanensis]GGJ11662.1 hypothetical protein GCM10008022_21030 [Paenibacillus hunanensis]